MADLDLEALEEIMKVGNRCCIKHFIARGETCKTRGYCSSYIVYFGLG